MNELPPKQLRQRVLRRVRYALNTRALLENLVPPEGPFDTALTNGLFEIVANEWPGQEWNGSSAKPASKLLDVIDSNDGLAEIDVEALREGLALTQPARHARADDEWDIIGSGHIAALAAIDGHPSLQVMARVAGENYDGALVAVFLDEASSHLPSRPKDRLDVPDIAECDHCWRMTFVQTAWDDFGRGDSGPGYCIACGHARDAGESYELAAWEEVNDRMGDGE